MAQLRTQEGKLYLFAAIDRTSKFAVTKLVEQANRETAEEFLEHLLEVVPYKIHTILTDNGIEFAEPPRNRITRRKTGFDLICAANDIEHRLTKANHPWTNGQVERMKCTIKEATVKRDHDDNHQQLRSHLQAFVRAYNFAKRLKTLRGLTPYEYVCKIWTKEPQRFKTNSFHHNMGPNTLVNEKMLDSLQTFTTARREERKALLEAIGDVAKDIGAARYPEEAGMLMEYARRLPDPMPEAMKLITRLAQEKRYNEQQVTQEKGGR